MSAALDISIAGRLPENITYFCRALRRAGVPVGTSQLMSAVQAVKAVGFTKRDDFYVTLQACLINRPEHLKVFDQVFKLFWRNPQFLENMMASMLPTIGTPVEEKKPKSAEARAHEAMMGDQPKTQSEKERQELEVDAQFSFSPNEVLKHLDFEVMSNAEIKDAERAIATMQLPLPLLQSRRVGMSAYGQTIDARKTIRSAIRTGGEVINLPKKRPRPKPMDLVVLCDISGSMSTYSRMMMHFIHTLTLKKTTGWGQVHAFTFGTRLSNITRSLSVRDPDAALKAISGQVNDWDGGTKIGECLKQFNLDWSRRVLGTNAAVLMITDGLERADTDSLENQMRRLRLSCRKIIWLNPLLRWDAFEPQAKGIVTILPYVDSFASCHSLASLQEISKILSASSNSGAKDKMMALL